MPVLIPFMRLATVDCVFELLVTRCEVAWLLRSGRVTFLGHCIHMETDDDFSHHR